jgi:hypothetical protein
MESWGRQGQECYGSFVYKIQVGENGLLLQSKMK